MIKIETFFYDKPVADLYAKPFLLKVLTRS
jgi:hypothetical protein